MDEMKETLNHILVNLFNRILVIEEDYLRNNGISLTIHEVHLLDKVRESETKTMSDVAKALNITQSTLSITAKRLIKKGYLIRERDLEDKRIFRLNISEKALESLNQHDIFHKDMINGFLKDIDVKDQKYLLKSLNSLVNFFDKYYKTEY